MTIPHQDRPPRVPADVWPQDTGCAGVWSWPRFWDFAPCRAHCSPLLVAAWSRDPQCTQMLPSPTPALDRRREHFVNISTPSYQDCQQDWLPTVLVYHILNYWLMIVLARHVNKYWLLIITVDVVADVFHLPIFLREYCLTFSPHCWWISDVVHYTSPQYVIQFHLSLNRISLTRSMYTVINEHSHQSTNKSWLHNKTQRARQHQ